MGFPVGCSSENSNTTDFPFVPVTIYHAIFDPSLDCFTPTTPNHTQMPVRSINCKHIQCFDLTSYLVINQRRPRWTCPICSSESPFRDLRVDEYVFRCIFLHQGITQVIGSVYHPAWYFWLGVPLILLLVMDFSSIHSLSYLL